MDASDAPNAVKLDIAPTQFNVVHKHRGSSRDKSGGGIAVVHRATIKATVIDVGEYKRFEVLAVKLVSRSSSFVVVCIYRPGSKAPPSAFFDDLSDLLDQLQVLDVKFVLCGDFNCPGDTRMLLDDRLNDVIDRYNLTQHVNMSTHTGGNMPDLILTMNNEAKFIANQSVKSVCFSDHRRSFSVLSTRYTETVTSYSNVQFSSY